MGTSPEAGIKPVEKQIKVRLNQEAAFQLFTEGLGRWWPLSSYSVGMAKAESCRMEGQVGGRIYEVMESGEESEWGRVTEWDPPENVGTAGIDKVHRLRRRDTSGVGAHRMGDPGREGGSNARWI